MFPEEETMRTSREDQSLRDDCNLKVHNHVRPWVVGLNGEISTQLDTESVLEEASLLDNDGQCNAKDQKGYINKGEDRKIKNRT